MSKVSILVVEDKIIVAQDIQGSLEDMGYHVPKLINNGKEAIDWVKENSPDLILMDINLKGDMDGIQAATEINRTRPTPIIYLTAYSDPKTLERARITHPYAYIVKPFDDKDLKIAMDLALHNFSSDHQSDAPPEGASTHMINENLFLKQDHRYNKVPVDDVLYIEASGSYIYIHTVNEKYTLAVNLQNFQNKVSNDDLMRVHRSYMVNLRKVDSFETNRLFVGEQEIPISSSLKKEVMKRFQQI